jgi:hypothetical protein
MTKKQAIQEIKELIKSGLTEEQALSSLTAKEIYPQ